MGGGSSGYGNGSGSNITKINANKQARHDKSSKKYIKGRSYTTIHKSTIQMFVGDNIGTAQRIGNNKYRVRSKQTIGIYIDKRGIEHPTTNAIIVTSKTGSHIYPSRPDDFKED